MDRVLPRARGDVEGAPRRIERAPHRIANASGALCLGVAVALLAPTAVADEAPDPSARIAQARSAIEDQRYEDALRLVAPLVDAPAPRVRAQALEITAISELILGRPADAKAPLAALYDLAPGFVLSDPSLPPRVTTEFDAEAARPHTRAVTLVVRPAPAASSAFDLRAGGDTARVALACKSRDEAPFAPVATRKQIDAYRFDLPLARSHRCYAVALDADELPLGRLGSAAQPFEIAPHPVASGPAPKPITSKPAFWIGGGVALVALIAGTAAIVAVATKPAPTKPNAELEVVAKPAGMAAWWLPLGAPAR